jgi:iron complex transport system permease protein
MQRLISVLLVLLLVWFFIAWCTLCVGSVFYSPWELWDSLWSYLQSHVTPREAILWELRLPRLLLASLVGFSLAIVGGTFQTLLYNPLAEPYLLGISSGASVGAILTTFLIGMSLWGMPLGAFAGAVVTIFAVYRLGQVRGILRMPTLLLAGVMVSFFCAAVVIFLISLAGPTQTKSLFFWLMGDLSGADFFTLIPMGAVAIVGALLIFWKSRDLNALALGEESAHHLGVSVRSTQRLLFFLGSLLTAIAVASSGVIGFVGLVIPHTARRLWGADHRLLIPASGLLGASFLVLADTIARTVMAPTELPVGVLTSLLGGPFFIYLLRRSHE